LSPRREGGEPESVRRDVRAAAERFAHNDAQPNLSDLHTSIANVNMCLRIVGDFRDKVAE
jgi:hypothetical protein